MPNTELSIAELDVIFDVFAKKAVNQEAEGHNSDYNWTIAFKAKQQADKIRYPEAHKNLKRRVVF